MKIFRNGSLYLCLCGMTIAAGLAPRLARAQDLAAAADQNPTSQKPTSQNPPQQQTPPAQNPTSQNPTSQNPTSQAPPAQTPDAPQQQPPSGPIVNAIPELPKYPDVRLPGEYGWYIGIDGWLPTQQPTFDKGRQAGFIGNGHIVMQGQPKIADGAEFGIALGLHNMLRASYFTTRAAGDFTPTVDTGVFGGQGYAAGTLVSTSYQLRNFKLSFDYLTWPYPVESRRFRLKTLWQLQYTSVKAAFDAPQLPLTDANGNPLIDLSTGNPVTYAASSSKWFMLPTFGASATEYFTHNIRFEASADGFAIPHHSTLYEGESTLNIRVSHIELRGGAKLFHYKTSTNSDFYLRGNLASVFFGIRWYSR